MRRSVEDGQSPTQQDNHLMPLFEHIEDRRQRALARLNYALRGGSAGGRDGPEFDNPLVQDTLKMGVNLTDFDRDVVAGHLLRSLEDELGLDLGNA